MNTENYGIGFLNASDIWSFLCPLPLSMDIGESPVTYYRRKDLKPKNYGK